jgi:hypothetical protein
LLAFDDVLGVADEEEEVVEEAPAAVGVAGALAALSLARLGARPSRPVDTGTVFTSLGRGASSSHGIEGVHDDSGPPTAAGAGDAGAGVLADGGTTADHSSATTTSATTLAPPAARSPVVATPTTLPPLFLGNPDFTLFRIVARVPEVRDAYSVGHRRFAHATTSDGKSNKITGTSPLFTPFATRFVNFLSKLVRVTGMGMLRGLV